MNIMINFYKFLFKIMYYTAYIICYLPFCIFSIIFAMIWLLRILAFSNWLDESDIKKNINLEFKWKSRLAEMRPIKPEILKMGSDI